MTRQPIRRDVIAYSVIAIVGSTSILALFLPFAYSTSPVEAVSYSETWQLGLPYFLAPLVVLGIVRWIVRGAFSPLERVAAYLAAATATVGTLSIYFIPWEGPATILEWLAWLFPLVTFSLGVLILIRNRSRKLSVDLNPIVAMQIPYLANAGFCLITFYEHWQMGAYMTVIAAVTFVVQIVFLVPQQPEAGSPPSDIARGQHIRVDPV
jgi:hypothetical protein